MNRYYGNPKWKSRAGMQVETRGTLSVDMIQKERMRRTHRMQMKTPDRSARIQNWTSMRYENGKLRIEN